MPPSPAAMLDPERPLRLLFLGHEATRTGAPMALLHLMRWVRDTLGWPCACVLQQGGDLEDEFRALGPTVFLDRGKWHPCGPRHRWLLGFGLAKMAPALHHREALAEVRRADLIYANTLDVGGMLELTAACPKPVVLHVHELEATIRTYIGREATRRVLDRSRRIVACAQAVADNLVANHGVSPNRIDVVHEFVPTAAADPSTAAGGGRSLREELGVGRETLLVGASGKLGWRKGTDLFLQLARLVGQQTPARDVRFLWLGGTLDSAEHEEFMYDAGHLGVERHVLHLPGRPDPMTFFRALDLFVLPSREDPYPLVCLEAAACGVPVLCFAGAGGMPEFVEEDAGQVVPYLDLAALADAVGRLLDDPARRRQLGHAARQKVQRRHDVAVAGPKILAAVRRACEDQP